MSAPDVPDPVAWSILSLPVPDPNWQPPEGSAGTVRDYLVALLVKLWRDGENFSGKRPFGMSGWQYDLYDPLLRAGLIEGSFDEDGYIDVCDDKAADRLILAAIRALGG